MLICSSNDDGRIIDNNKTQKEDIYIFVKYHPYFYVVNQYKKITAQSDNAGALSVIDILKRYDRYANNILNIYINF